MAGEGNGWAAGPHGVRYWGRYGAAGLLLAHRSANGFCVLMQHRAHWTSRGDTWALPGGARDPGETAAEAAGREAYEETGIECEHYRVLDSLVTAGPYPADPQRPELAGNWTYTTVVALAPERLATRANEESYELRWVPDTQVQALNLMPEFARTWEELREHVHSLLRNEPPA